MPAHTHTPESVRARAHTHTRARTCGRRVVAQLAHVCGCGVRWRGKCKCAWVWCVARRTMGCSACRVVIVRGCLMSIVVSSTGCGVGVSGSHHVAPPGACAATAGGSVIARLRKTCRNNMFFGDSNLTSDNMQDMAALVLPLTLQRLCGHRRPLDVSVKGGARGGVNGSVNASVVGSADGSASGSADESANGSTHDRANDSVSGSAHGQRQ